MAESNNRWTARDNNHRKEIVEKTQQLQELRKNLVEAALGLIGSKGIRYRGEHNGMSIDTGFDCSGFVVAAVSAAIERTSGLEGGQLTVPRHANEQWRMMGEFVHYDQRISGDLVYFTNKKIAGLYALTHVGIVIDSRRYVHAPGKDDTLIEIAELPEQPEALQGVTNEDIYAFNPVGVKRLVLPLANGRWNVH